MKHQKLCAAALSFTLIFSIFSLSACSNAPKQQVTLHASWAESYDSVEELTASSDFVGLVEITGIDRVDDSRIENPDDYTLIPMTTFNARVLDSMVSDETELKIYMTGERGDDTVIEIRDDPLMDIGEKWFIFARKNDDDTYTILAPDGRFAYVEQKQILTQLILILNKNITPGQMNENDKIPEGYIAPMTLEQMRTEVNAARAK